MIEITTVSTTEELEQIYNLNKQNIKQNLTADEKQQQGFVTWLYSLELLQQMHQLAPSVIAKDGDKVVGYALVTPREASGFHPDLATMIAHTEVVQYKGKTLHDYRYYIMGQICIAKEYRSKGLFSKLYEQHQTLHSHDFDLLVTEVSTSNIRSQRAHEKVGFTTIHTYNDVEDEWNVVVWDWNN